MLKSLTKLFFLSSLLVQMAVYADPLSFQGKIDTTATSSQPLSTETPYLIPVLMATKKQKNVPIDLKWLADDPSLTVPTSTTPLSNVQLFELVTHLLAEVEGFADWTSKKVEVVYELPVGNLTRIKCNLNKPEKECMWPSNAQGSIHQIKAVYVKYNNREIILDNLWKGVTASASTLTSIVLPLALR